MWGFFRLMKWDLLDEIAFTYSHRNNDSQSAPSLAGLWCSSGCFPAVLIGFHDVRIKQNALINVNL